MSENKNISAISRVLRSSSNRDFSEIDLSSADCSQDNDLDWESLIDDEEDGSAVTLPVGKDLRPAQSEKSRPNGKHRKSKPDETKKKLTRAAKNLNVNKRVLTPSEADNLPECRTVADIGKLREKQNGDFLRKALAGPNNKAKREALGDMYGDCVRAISGEATDHPTMVSHRVLTDAYEHTGRGLIAMVEKNPSLQVIMATIVSDDGATSSDVPIVNVEHEIAKAKKFASRVTRDFFGVVEVVHFNSHKHKAGGRVIQTHSHMLLIGEKIFEKAQAVAKTFGETLPRNFTDARQIDVKLVDVDNLNLMKVASYLFKPPHKAKTWNPPRDGKKGHMHHSTKGDRGIIFFRMAMILSMLPLDKVIFAGGECKTIKSGAIKDVRSNCETNCKNPNRMLAPDTIGSFWVEVSKVFNRPKWHLPVIITKR